MTHSIKNCIGLHIFQSKIQWCNLFYDFKSKFYQKNQIWKIQWMRNSKENVEIRNGYDLQSENRKNINARTRIWSWTKTAGKRKCQRRLVFESSFFVVIINRDPCTAWFELVRVGRSECRFLRFSVDVFLGLSPVSSKVSTYSLPGVWISLIVVWLSSSMITFSKDKLLSGKGPRRGYTLFNARVR